MTKLAVVFALLTASLAYSANPPRAFYTDLTSGPKTGGESNNGAYVTVYGLGFGSSQGASTVTVGGGAVTNYKIWTDTKIAFQLGASAATGSVIVTTTNGSSTALPFTVRTGNIYFVATTGNDSTGNGSFATPWRTIPKSAASVVAGDIVYVETGVNQTSLDNFNSALWLGDSGTGTSTNPIALGAYPGAAVTIGASGVQIGIRGSNFHGTNDWWTIFGMKAIGGSGGEAVDLLDNNNWRVVGNEFTCPGGAGQAACYHVDSSVGQKFYGNYIHNVGDTAGSIDKYYHAVYFTTNSNTIDVGWNTIVPNPGGSTTQGGCRALQFFSTGGSDQFDLHVHDNLIHDAICDGINFATVNPDSGTVEAYNNIVYHVGTGPVPTNGGGNFSCLLANTSNSPVNPVEVYNNTFYDCGSLHGTDAGAITPNMKVRLRNNITLLLSGEAYITPSTAGNCSSLTFATNIWNGAGTPLCSQGGNVNPLFVSTVTPDFHLQSGSPAIAAGTNLQPLAGTDYDGVTRPSSGAYDEGALQFAAGSVTTWGISGTITSGASASVALTGTATASTTADGSGNYSFSGLSAGTYTVTPTKAGFSMSPTSLPETISSSNITGANFTATALPPGPPVNLTGKVVVSGKVAAQ